MFIQSHTGRVLARLENNKFETCDVFIAQTLPPPVAICIYVCIYIYTPTKVVFVYHIRIISILDKR